MQVIAIWKSAFLLAYFRSRAVEGFANDNELL